MVYHFIVWKYPFLCIWPIYTCFRFQSVLIPAQQKLLFSFIYRDQSMIDSKFKFISLILLHTTFQSDNWVINNNSWNYRNLVFYTYVAVCVCVLWFLIRVAWVPLNNLSFGLCYHRIEWSAAFSVYWNMWMCDVLSILLLCHLRSLELEYG